MCWHLRCLSGASARINIANYRTTDESSNPIRGRISTWRVQQIAALCSSSSAAVQDYKTCADYNLNLCNSSSDGNTTASRRAYQHWRCWRSVVFRTRRDTTIKKTLPWKSLRVCKTQLRLNSLPSGTSWSILLISDVDFCRSDACIITKQVQPHSSWKVKFKWLLGSQVNSYTCLRLPDSFFL